MALDNLYVFKTHKRYIISLVFTMENYFPEY